MTRNSLHVIEDGRPVIMTPSQIFDWPKYTRLYAVTYSGSNEFIRRYLWGFDDIRLLMGNPSLHIHMKNGHKKSVVQECAKGVHHIFELKDFRFGKEPAVFYHGDFSSHYQVHVPSHGVIHTKMYLLANNLGENRLIEGSANLSFAGMSNQSHQEERISIYNDDESYSQAMSYFDRLWANSTDLLTHRPGKKATRSSSSDTGLHIKAPQSSADTSAKSSSALSDRDSMPIPSGILSEVCRELDDATSSERSHRSSQSSLAKPKWPVSASMAATAKVKSSGQLSTAKSSSASSADNDKAQKSSRSSSESSAGKAIRSQVNKALSALHHHEYEYADTIFKHLAASQLDAFMHASHMTKGKYFYAKAFVESHKGHDDEALRDYAKCVNAFEQCLDRAKVAIFSCTALYRLGLHLLAYHISKDLGPIDVRLGAFQVKCLRHTTFNMNDREDPYLHALTNIETGVLDDPLNWHTYYMLANVCRKLDLPSANRLYRDTIAMAGMDSTDKGKHTYQALIHKIAHVDHFHSHNSTNHESNSEQLDELIGLKPVKSFIKQFSDRALIHKLRSNKPDFGADIVFEGNPGTGKTTVARLLSGILYEKGIIPKDRFVVANLSNIIRTAFHWGEGQAMRNTIRQALGGVLFVDEAYRMYAPHNRAMNNIMDVFIQGVENHHNDLIVIMAGYTGRMEHFLNHDNPGLASRFPPQMRIQFPDYSTSECFKIFKLFLRHKGYHFNDSQAEHEAYRLIRQYIPQAKHKYHGSRFGNARDMRSLSIAPGGLTAYTSSRLIKTYSRSRIANVAKSHSGVLSTITSADVQALEHKIIKPPHKRRISNASRLPKWKRAVDKVLYKLHILITN